MARFKSDGGGSILDQSHIMDLAHYLIGPFKKFIAFCCFKDKFPGNQSG